MTVRRFLPSDREEFLQMTDDFYTCGATLADIPRKYHEDAFDTLLESDRYAEGYIIEHGGEIAGYAILLLSYIHEAGGMQVLIDELYVKPEYRCHGLGREFFALCEAREDIRVARLRLETEHDNVRAEALYRSLGFYGLPYKQMIKDFGEE